MNSAFADTCYWIAVANKHDSLHTAAKVAKETLGDVRIVTTDEVLTEFLNGLAGRGGPALRNVAVLMVRAVLRNPNVRVLPQSRDSFLRGLERYEKREDKGYSLTDCISMNVMDAERLSQALTGDHHFEQEGFQPLISNDP